MKEKGYRTVVLSYHGMNYQYKCIKKRDKISQSIDFHLQRIAGDYAWRPQTGPIDVPFYGIAGRVFKFIRLRGILGIYLSILPFCSKHINVTGSILRSYLKVGICWTPAHFFQNIIKLEGWDCYIPRDWDEYLTFKYRDWRTPFKGSWNYWTTEGGLIQQDPLFFKTKRVNLKFTLF